MDMTQTLEATFDGIVFRPDKPVKIKPNTRVRIVVKTNEETNQTVGEVAGHLFGEIDVDGPTDLSTNKNHMDGFGE